MYLAVDECELPALELVHECREGHLRRVVGLREHRLAEEAAPERDTVEAARQRVAAPGLGRVREAEFVQAHVGVDHIGGDPAAPLTGTRNLGAAVHDALEGRVERQSEDRPAQRALQAARQVQLCRAKRHARIRRVPEDREPVFVPGKDAKRVREQQALGREITADGEQSVGLRLLGRREDELAAQAVDGHRVGRHSSAALTGWPSPAGPRPSPPRVRSGTVRRSTSTARRPVPRRTRCESGSRPAPRPRT